MNNIMAGNNNLSEERDEQSVFPVYKCYPLNKPFINDNLRLDATRSYTPFPESNRQAILSALRNLQKKIKQLENEKNEALVTLHEMTLQTNLRKDKTNLLGQSKNKTFDQSATLHELSNLNLKLDLAEQRCKALDDQLNRLKQTYREHFQSVQPEVDDPFNEENKDEDDLNIGTIDINEGNNDGNRRLTNSCAIGTEEQCHKQKSSRLSEEKKRLDFLKKITEDKVKILELQLEQERNQYRMIEEKARELIKTRQSIGTRQTHRTSYRHNLHHLSPPHPKHRIPTNQLQSTLRPRASETRTLLKSNLNEGNGSDDYIFDRTRLSESDEDINGLLFQLREEFAHLQIQYDEMQRGVRNIVDPNTRSDVEREIDNIRFKMEIKQDQIDRVVNLQRKKNYWKDGAAKLAEQNHLSADLNNDYRAKHSHDSHVDKIQTKSTTSNIPLSEFDKEVQILTTITTKGKANLL